MTTSDVVTKKIKEDLMGFRISNRLSTETALALHMRSNEKLARSISRLSSGLRIETGADDPTGLTLSEKIRSQIRGTQRAATNTQDGVSIIQTADGALTEDNHILNRLRELSIQAQSDALTSNDRIEIQREVDEMLLEIDKVSSTTEFNERRILDGSAAATVTSNSQKLSAYQTGESVNSGTYKLEIRKTLEGASQAQTSGIQIDTKTGEIASFDTHLGDLKSMTDSHGNSFLSGQETITIRGNGTTHSLQISAETTIEEFTQNLQTALRDDQSNGGLEITGSSFRFDPDLGQWILTSGREGISGEISLSMDEGLTRAFNFSQTREAEDPGHRITATQQDVLRPLTIEGRTTDNRTGSLFPGVDLKFDLASEARVDGAVSGIPSITVDNIDVVFTLHDTNAQYNDQAPFNISAGVTVTLTRSRTYAVTSVVDIVNTAVSFANDPTSPYTPPNTSSQYGNPGLIAANQGFDLILASTLGGNSSLISVAANLEAQNILGLVNGSFAGSAGFQASITGTVDISGGLTVAGTGVLRIQVGDGDFNTGGPPATSNDISFNRGVALGSASILSAFNTYFGANSVNLNAAMTGTGELQLLSTDTGDDARVSISGGAGLVDLGFTGSLTNSGTFGNSAFATSGTSLNNAAVGFTLLDTMSLRLADQSGFQTETITFATAQTTPGQSFTISRTQLVSILDASSISQSGVAYQFDAANRLDFFSRQPGTNNKITLFSNGLSQSVGQKGFGIDFNGQTQGRNRAEFELEVRDSALRFQTGPDQGQMIHFQIGAINTDSLGLKGMDLTNIDRASRAIQSIDKAMSMAAGARSNLGAVQNEMLHTVKRLRVTELGLQTSESRIRDTDVAQEVLELTRQQMLSDASVAQLMHSRELGQVSSGLI